MTAQNLFVGPQAATLLTDQGYFHDDGTIQGLGSKVIASDRLKLAISPAGRNCVAWTEQGAVARDPTSQALERLLEDAATSFAVLDALPGALRSVLQEVEEMVAEPGVEPGPCAPYVQLCIALWNERHERPEGYVIGSPGHDLKGLLPYKIAGVAEPSRSATFTSLNRAVAVRTSSSVGSPAVVFCGIDVHEAAASAIAPASNRFAVFIADSPSRRWV